MQNKFLWKGLVVGIIILFIGAGVFPVLGFIDINEKLIENQIQIESELQNDAGSQGVDYWPMFHHDLNNSGYSSSQTAPNINNIKWVYDIPYGVNAGCSPAVVDDRLYIGAETLDDKYFCLNAETGQLIWKIDLPGGTGIGSPAVVDGRLYQGSSYEYVYCFDADTGEQIWRFHKGYGPCLSPAVSNGNVYISYVIMNDPNSTEDYDPRVCCLDADTGDEIWNQALGGNAEIGHVAVYDGKIYVSHYYGWLYCLDGETGNIIWYNYTSGRMGAPVIANGKVYASANGIRCFDPDTGVELWHYQGATSYCSPSIAYDRIYYTSSDGKVLCLDADTGDELWSFITGSSYEHAFPSPAVADGKLYVGIWSNGYLLCLDAYTGELIWKYLAASPDWFFGSPAIVDGRLYISGGGKNKIYCFEDPSKPPTDPTINGPFGGKPGEEYEFTFKSSDPEGGKVYYFVDWGDDNNSGWIGPYSSGKKITLSHTWAEVDTYVIQARSKDTDGIKSHWSEFEVVISDPPTAPIIDGPSKGTIGMSYCYNFTSSDPDGDQISYYIKWDDGGITDWSIYQDSGTVYITNHTWSSKRKFTIQAKSKDIYGAESNWSEFTVTMPRAKSLSSSSLLRFFERYPLLNYFLQRLTLL